MTAVEGTWSWPSPCVAPAEQPGREAVPQSLKHSVGFGCDKLGRPGSCLLSSTQYCRAAIRRLEDLCVSRQSRLPSKSSSPES